MRANALSQQGLTLPKEISRNKRVKLNYLLFARFVGKSWRAGDASECLESAGLDTLEGDLQE